MKVGFCETPMFNLSMNLCGIALVAYYAVLLVSLSFIWEDVYKIFVSLFRSIPKIIKLCLKISKRIIYRMKLLSNINYKSPNRLKSDSFGYELITDVIVPESTKVSLENNKEISSDKILINPDSGYCDYCRSNIFCPLKIYKLIYSLYTHLFQSLILYLILICVLIMFNVGDHSLNYQYMYIPHSFTLILLNRVLFDSILYFILRKKCKDIASDAINENSMSKFADSARLGVLAYNIVILCLLLADIVLIIVNQFAKSQQYSAKFIVYFCLIMTLVLFLPILFSVKAFFSLTQIIEICQIRKKYIKKPTSFFLNELKSIIESRKVSKQAEQVNLLKILSKRSNQKSVKSLTNPPESDQSNRSSLTEIQTARLHSSLEVPRNSLDSLNISIRQPSTLLPSLINTERDTPIAPVMRIRSPLPESIIPKGCGCKCCSENQTYSYGNVCGMSICSVFSNLSFSWVTYFIRKSKSKIIEFSDLYPLPSTLNAVYIYDRFLPAFLKNSRSLFKFIFIYSKKEFLLAALLKFIYDTLQLLLTVIINKIIKTLNQENDKIYFFSKRDVTIIMLMLLAISKLFQTVCLHQYFKIQYLIGFNLQSGLNIAIYNKSLKLNLSNDSQTVQKADNHNKKGCFKSCRRKTKNKQGNSNDFEHSTGNIVNLMSIDTLRIANSMPYIQILWSAVYQIFCSLILLYLQIREALFGCIAVIIVIFVFAAILIKKVKRLQVQMTKKTDKRVRMINEFLNGNRICKMYGWEVPLLKKISSIRDEELSLLKKQQLHTNLQYLLWRSVSIVISIVAFGLYVKLGYKLTPDVAFTTLSLIDIIRFPLNVLPSTVSTTTFASVASSRIEAFLKLPEIKSKVIRKNTGDPRITAIYLTSIWPNKSLVLNNVSFKCLPGSITAIIGKTGAGKTGLLKTILGELEICDTTVDGNLISSLLVDGRIAYTAQSAWIQNNTVEKNITFGRPYQKDWYLDVINACALKDDFKILPQNDQTEIGEKGVNLSGGQKQRIALARATYRAKEFPNDSELIADIFVLDDCLSAVDINVANHIFKNCIVDILKARNKIVIMATHKIDILSRVDTVIFMNEMCESKSGSSVIFVGPPSELFKLPEYIEFTKSHKEKLPKPAKSLDMVISSDAENFTINQKRHSSIISLSSKNSDEVVPLIKEEIVSIDSIKFHVFLSYCNGSGGFIIVSIIIFILLSSYATIVVNRIFLAAATNSISTDPENSNEIFHSFFRIYILLGVLQVVLFLIASISHSLSAIKASRFFHGKMLRRILRAPLSYFESTPTGRLLNRFSRDMNIIDTVLPINIFSYLNTLFAVLEIIVTIIYFLPWFVAFCIPISIFYLSVQKIFLPCTRQLQRMQNVLASPVLNHFSETLNGATTIRAFQEEQRFMETNNENQELIQRANFLSIVTNRWLGMRLETVGILIVAISTNLSVYSIFSNPSATNFVGFYSILSYVTSVTQTLNWMVRMASDTQSNIVSVERVQNLIDETPLEASLYLKDADPEKETFKNGRIQFVNYCLRYRPSLPLVLNNISCVIEATERIGLVGRTGAGKSSIMLALLRLIEADSGQIIIDDIDIATMGLNSLRTQISIIPQDSVLFSGTLRFNLDPFAPPNCSSFKLPYVLENYFNTHFANGLDQYITEEGKNLSLGQKQLICLARAFIRKSKVLLLDEATSSLDVYTDQLIQNTIRTEFTNCTIITIAHRIETVLDYDKIMVLDQGRLIEFDSPVKLLQNPNNIFTQLYKQHKL